ncbi:MAG TPA: MBL fold metallo-hydrolase [Candidatus Paceibacterota bacterium]|nr:MBL fold metallo-hydrolase [Candidatus Paceibacterota bacterium]
MTAKLSFMGGAGSVTGANFLLDLGEETIMVDCGLVQEGRFSMEKNCEAFAYDPSAVGTLFVTHAHADHIGRIPKLVRDGFRGIIYSTPPTRDLAAVMLEDAYHVMASNRERYSTDTCFELEDIAAALRLWKTVEYHEPVGLSSGATATFTDAGHILGSAMVTIERKGKRIAFTGDIGNVPQPLLNPPEALHDYDYLVMESVYGDRLHEGVEKRAELLREHLEDTVRKGGTLIIPAFSLERTQGMLFEINNLFESGAMKPIPVFLDSPLAIRVTGLYKKYTNYLKDAVRAQIEGGDDVFDFPRLAMTETAEASRGIDAVHGAKVIIAGSGMSHGGRILAHEIKYLEDPKTTLLLVGYQAVGSIGRLLGDGAKKVKILDRQVRVRAKVAQIHGYSGHADRDQLVEFVGEGSGRVRQVFVTMGEERSSLFLVQRLRDYLGVRAVAPELGSSVDIDL